MRKLMVAIATAFIASAAFAHGDEDHRNKESSASGTPPAMDHGQMAGMKTESNAASAEMTQGEVRKVDKDAKKITLKHGDIKNLGMPGMTMVFQVKDPAMLDAVKAGDKVKFRADKVGGALTVTEIEVAP
jgi:Cu(I)/Ag(I) efflux system protein CusF